MYILQRTVIKGYTDLERQVYPVILDKQEKFWN